MSRIIDYTQANATASDDFFVVDGATNNTRKLSAHSPSFGGGVTAAGASTLNGTSIPASKTLVVTTDKISVLAATTSAELAGVITDETGTGALVFANSPILVTPNIGAATGTSVNLSGAGTFGGNLTVSGIGTIGSGGAGATTGTLLLSGSSANDTGPYITFSRNSVAKGYIGTASGVTGGSSDNLVVYTSALAATFSGANTTLAGNLSVRNALGYATGIHTGTTSDSTQQLLLSSNAAYNHAYISKGSTTLGIGFSSDNGSFVADDSITITAATKLVTLTGNLTVSGAGTNGFKAVSLSDGATYGGLTLNGAIASGTMSGIYGGGDSNLYATAPTSVWILTAGTEQARFTSTATTLAGNLTVSGAGNSSVAGNLGIGETSPVVPLHVKTTGTGTGDFDNAIATLRSTAAGRTITLQFSDTTNQSYISSKSGALNFGVGGATLGMSLSSGGNLTVSGTGTSSFGGVVQVSNTLAAKETNASLTLQPGPGTGGINYAFGQGTGDHVWYGGTTERMRLTYLGNFLIGTTNDAPNARLHVLGANNAGLRIDQGSYNYYSAYEHIFQAVSFGTIYGKFTNNGSLILKSDGVDSGNGRLQLATHSSYTGGIGFGPDTSLYRSQTGMLALDGLTGSLSQLDLRVGGVQKAFVAWNGGDFYLGAVVGTTVIKSSNTTALTLDSSQNATFAGTSVTVDGASTGSTLTLKRASNANGAIISYKTTTTSKWYHGLRGLVDDNWYLQNDVAGNTALFFDASTSNATFAGNLTVSGGQALISHSGTYANIYFSLGASTYSEIRAFSSTGEFRTNSGPSAGWGGFLTWQTDASEKMRLTNGGNLGIGTTSPNAKLEIGLGSISGSEPNQYLRVNASTYNSALSANLDLLNWGNNFNNSLGWRISAINSAGVTTQRDLAFSSLVDAGSGTVGAATERMRLFGTGNLFIGASPVDGGQKLQVSGTANFSSGSSANTLSLISTDSTTYSATGYNSAYRLWLYGNGATSAYNFIRFSGGGSNEAAFGTVQNASGRAEFVWQTYDGSAYGERLRIASGGNVGIGTTSPLGVLDVRSTTPDVLFNGKDTADPVLYFGRYQYDNVSKSGAAIKYVHGSAGGSQEYGRLAFLTATGSFGALTERMRINESGNVGIGTTTPGAQLEIGGTNPEIRLGPVSSSSGAYMSYNTAGNYFSLNAVTQGVGYRNLVFANDGGNLLIGKTTPDTGEKLQVSGTAAIAGTTKITNGNLQVYGYVGNNALAAIFLNEDQSSYIYNDGAQVNFRSGGVDGLKLASGTGNATFAGTVTLPNDKAIYFKEVGGTAQRFALNSGDVIYIEPDQLHKISIGGAGVTNVGVGGIGVAGNSVFGGNAAISGSLLAGKTTTNLATVGFRVDTDGAAYASVNSSVDNATSYNLWSTSASAYRFYVGLGGTVFATNTTISAISDVRLKENIRDLSGGLSSILALKPRVFDWKEGKGANKKNVRGFIAQEIEQVFPDLVDEWKDPAPDGESPYKSVRQDLIPVLVKAIQELTARVVALENA